MYEKGLAYKKRSTVNFCTKCDTVLANEQVEGGLCWRCGTEVQEKVLDQWFFKITAYIEELLEYCDKLPGWPERVMTMQKNWIGKSYGCEVDFPMADAEGAIKVFHHPSGYALRRDLHAGCRRTSAGYGTGQRQSPAKKMSGSLWKKSKSRTS